MLSSISWINPNGGNWDTASNWSSDTIPTASDAVTINIAVSNPITHSASNSDFVNSLTSQDPITLSGGSLTIGTTASLSAPLTLAGGTINGGTIDLSGGATIVGTSSGGTLAGVTLDGTLDMTGDLATVTVRGGLTLDGTIELGSTNNTSYYGDLNFQGAQTLGGTGSVVFGDSGNNAINTASANGDSGTLTIGPGITIDGEYGLIGYDGGGNQTPLVVQGTIASTGGENISIYGAGWTNSGTLEAENGGTLRLNGTWTDSGTIIADSSSAVYLGGTFSLGSSSSFGGAGSLDLTGTLDNSGTTLSIDTSGLTLALLGGTVNGGTIDLSGGATIVGTSSGGTLAGVTLDGTLDMTGDLATVTVRGGLTLDGTIELGSTNNTSYYGDLNFQGAQTLGGTGSVVFGDSGNNAINTASANGDSGTLTIGPGITIDGEYGLIGYDGGGNQTPLVVQGTIASTGGENISIYGAGWTNSGTLEAENGGTLRLNGTWTDSGTIIADSSSAVYLGGTFSLGSSSSFGGAGSLDLTGTLDNSGTTLSIDTSGLTLALLGGTVNGGTIDLSGGATIVGTSSGGTLAGVTLDGTLDMTGDLATVTVRGGLTLDGTIELGSTNNTSYYGDLNFQGAQTLGGTGSVVFGDSGNNAINTASANGDSGTLTIGPGITIDGEYGLIGYDGGGNQTPLVVQGTIASTGGENISIYGAGWTNSGTLEAENGGTLRLNGTWTDSGTIIADSSSAVYLGGTFSLGSSSSFGGAGSLDLTGTLDNSGTTLSIDTSGLTLALLGGTVNGGTIDLSGGATIVGTSSGGTLAGVTLDGTLDMTGDLATVTVRGGLTLDGTIELGSTNNTSYYGDLNFQGAQTLGGTGSVVFGDSGNNAINTASANGDSGTLTIGPGITIDGEYGLIGYDGGGNQTPLVVQGTIASTGGENISIYGAGWTNSGTLEANGGTLKVNGTWSSSGSVEAIGGGSFSASIPSNLSSGALTGGTWLVGANSSLNLGTSITDLAAAVTLQGSGSSFSGLSSLVTIGSTGDLTLQGGAALSLPGNLDNAGTIDIAPGTLKVAGNYTQETTGTLGIGIGGTTSGSQFGQLNVTGQASLDGTLGISLIDQFVPQQGESYRILNFGSRASDFAVELGLYLGEGEGFIPTYDSSGLDLVVASEEIGSTTAVVSSLDPSDYGQAITFTATVTPALSTSFSPTGDVTFYDGSTDLGSAPIADDSASFTTSALAVGSHSIFAEYNGDSNFNASESPPLAQNVNKAGTETDLESSENPSIYGDGVIFTATVSPTVSGIGPPTGQVTFYDGSTALDTETLSDGSASFTTSALAVGNHAITASYGGDTNFAGSSTTAVSQTVQSPPPATLIGEVYNDANGSGTVTAGAGLSGWTVNLLGSSNQVVSSTTTSSNGDFSFSGVFPGSYTIAVSPTTGYVPTVPASGTLAVTAGRGQTIDNLDFGEFRTVTIAGEVIDDSNESGLAGWTIDLLNGSNQVVQTATTDSSGDFSFTGIGPGTFTLAEVVQAGYVQTAPASRTYSIVTASGVNLSGEDFGDLEGPSLSVTGLAITPSSGLQSGANFVVSWNDTNSGDLPVSMSYTDLVTVTNQTTGQVLAQAAVTYNESARGNLGVGASAAQQYTFRLPDGVPGVGQIETTVVANDYGSITGYQTSTAGTASITETSTIAPYPDLQVQDLAVSPAAIVSGSTVEVTWNDANTGNAPVDQAFVDNLTVVNTTTGTTLLNTDIGYDPTQSGNSPIAAGGSQPQAYSFTLPQGDPGVGSLTFTVTTDANNQIFEYNPQGTGETNNTASLTVTSALAAYPELVTSDVTAPATAVPGQPISVGWTLTNSGNATASGPWTEQVLLATDSSGDDQTLLESQTFTGSLAAGQSVPDSATVTMPSLPAANYWIVVSENPLGELFELDAANDTAVAAQPTSIAGALTLTLASHTESDAAGPNATTATVTRNTDTTDPLVVTIANSDPTDATAPQTVTIPSGATSVVFPVGTINNDIVEGTQTATLTASASGLISGSDTLTVTDTNVPTLTLVLNSHTVNETDSNPATYGTVTRNTSTTSALTVSLLSNEINKLTVPATVTIPAGATSATFPVTVVNDQQIDGNETATITASASGFLTGSDSAVVVDDNVPSLSLTLADQTVSEAAGDDATTGTVSIASPASQPITITLTSSDTTAATVPTSVVIAAGQESASFPIAAIDNGLDIGNQTAIITASVETDAGVILVQGSADASLLLENANGPDLSLSFGVSAVEKGATATATLTRNTDTSDALVVTLASSDPTKAAVPPTVTIPAGQTSVTFTVNAIDDHIPDGLQQVQIFATATGFDTGIATLGITDVDLPDLVVSSVTAPTSAYDNTPLNISWTVTNSGQYPASGSWVDQIYLDPVGGPQSTTPADSVTFNGTVNAGQSYTQTDTIPSPSTVGQYIVRVVTDSGQSVQELSFSNNTGVAAQPLNDQAAYSATVTPSATTVSAGTPVVLYGVATLTSDGAPAADVPVAVQILVAGTTRTLTATTAANGSYSVTFQPLPNEAGDYSVTAADPGVTNPAVQAQFEIVGMTASPANANVTVVPNTPLTGTFTLTNLSDVTLTGLTATASGGPAGLTVQFTTPSQITGDGTATLGYSLDETSTQAASGAVTIQVTTTQGAVLNIPLGVSVVPLTPILAVNPGSLSTGMLVGAQTLISFTVVNNGGAPVETSRSACPVRLTCRWRPPRRFLRWLPGHHRRSRWN